MSEFGIREGVLLAIGVLVIYLLIMLLRLIRPSRPSKPSASPAAAAPTEPVPIERAPVPVPVAAPVPVSVAVPVPVAAPVPVPEAAPEPEDDDALGYAEHASPSAAFGLLDLFQLETQQLRRDVAQIRGEQDQLRQELASLRRSMDELQSSEGRLNYLRPVSPQHSEAMVLAERGLPAIQIAERCGISVAEAELVCALARREVAK